MSLARPGHCLRGLAILAMVLGLRSGPPPVARADAGAESAAVVLVILGGGVRSRDMLDPNVMPTLCRLGQEGVTVDRVRSDAPDAWAAAARILTGADEALDGAARQPPGFPTLMEYVRDAGASGRDDVWYVSFDAGTETDRLSCSTHPEFGSALAPSTAPEGGSFAGPLGGLLERMGRPIPIQEEAWAPLRAMRAASREAASIWLPADVDAGLAAAERVERALLRELDRRSLLNEGPNPRDELAWRAVCTILDIHAPRLLVVRLGEAEVAAVDVVRYRAVLAANDQGLARTVDSIASHPKLAGRTTLVVLADRGRDEKEHAPGRLAETDRSSSRRDVALVAWGAGLLSRKKPRGALRLEDVCPTLGALLGVATPHVQGRAWGEVLRPR